MEVRETCRLLLVAAFSGLASVSPCADDTGDFYYVIESGSCVKRIGPASQVKARAWRAYYYYAGVVPDGSPNGRWGGTSSATLDGLFAEIRKDQERERRDPAFLSRLTYMNPLYPIAELEHEAEVQPSNSAALEKIIPWPEERKRCEWVLTTMLDARTALDLVREVWSVKTLEKNPFRNIGNVVADYMDVTQHALDRAMAVKKVVEANMTPKLDEFSRLVDEASKELESSRAGFENIRRLSPDFAEVTGRANMSSVMALSNVVVHAKSAVNPFSAAVASDSTNSASSSAPNPFSKAAGSGNPFSKSTGNPFSQLKATPFNEGGPENPFARETRLEKERLAKLEQERLEQERLAKLERERLARLAALKREREQEEERQRAEAEQQARESERRMAQAKARERRATASSRKRSEPARGTITLTASSTVTAEYEGLRRTFEYGGTTGRTKEEAEKMAKNWSNGMRRSAIKDEYYAELRELDAKEQEARAEHEADWRQMHPPAKLGDGGAAAADVTYNPPDAGEERRFWDDFKRHWAEMRKIAEEGYKERLAVFPD